MTEMTNEQLNLLVHALNNRVHSSEPLEGGEALVIACHALTCVGHSAKARRRSLAAGTLMRDNKRNVVEIDAAVWDEVFNFLRVVGGDDEQRPH